MTVEGEEIRRRMEEEGGAPFPAGGVARDLLARFAGEVERWGNRTHLVGKSNIEKNILISLLDSLHLLRFAERSGDFGRNRRGRITVADIGSGAGFPGIVWAIARPGIDVALFERREKPRIFLDRTVTLLGLGEIVSVGGEARSSEMAGRFDVAVSKAAGRLDTIVPIAAELLSPEGTYITIKGEGWKGEVSGAAKGAMSLASSERLPGGRGAMLRFRRIPR
jgi:16S rRNA (guanine527-N7)-methyltransferase